MEALWLCKRSADGLHRLHWLHSSSVTIHCSRQGTISLARNPIASLPLSKHMVCERGARWRGYGPMKHMI